MRADVTARSYAEFNAKVFDGGLPSDLPITWSAKLRCVCGYMCVHVCGDG